MLAMMSEKLGNMLDEMWNAHRDFLRRFLIGLTRDIDLADDLLQESYLKARAGIEGYRGGEPRAWLTAIARNAFNSHLRRRYVRFESSLSEDDVPAPGPMDRHLDLIDIRRAIASLPKAQRDALVMKHYGGYSYEDIAAHMSCATGTAKSRVSLAIRRLRKALVAALEEPVEMKCAELSERMLLDFVYGLATKTQHARVEAHLAACAACRARAAEIGLVLHALDAVEAEVKGTGIIKLHADGTATVFVFVRHHNDTGKTRDTLDIGGDFETINSVLVNGEEAVIEPIPGQESQGAKLRLASPIAPGGVVELLMTGTAQVPEEADREIGGGVRRMGPGKLIFDEEILFVMAVRLPPKASLAKATPEPQEIRSNGATTVMWRKVHLPNEKFEFTVEYQM